MLDLIGFFTRLPCGSSSIDKAAEYSFLLPILGGLIGLIVGIFSLFVFNYLDGLLAALLTIVAVYLITGLNHLDGLADFADGMYTSGSKQRRIEAMKDVQTGIAGVTIVLFSILFLVYAIFMINGDVYKIIVAEIGAKTGMLFALFIGKPMKSGLGKVFIENLNKTVVPFSILFSLVISFVLLQIMGIITVIVSICVSLVMVIVAHRAFGKVNGDVLGAINEVSRIVSLYALLLIV